MNSVNLIGRLTKDVELRNTNNGKPVGQMRLAVDRRDRDKGAVFVDVVVFGKQAETCSQYLAKGRKVAVAGRLEHSEWKTDDGQPRSKHEVIANQVEFLDRRPQGNGDTPEQGSSPEEPTGAYSAPEEDIAF